MKFKNFRSQLGFFLLLGSVFFSSACKRKHSDVDSKTFDSTRALVVARAGDSVGLDLARHDDGESLTIGINILEGLLAFKSGTTQVVPSLATSWTISKDGLHYIFKLRANVLFQDGTPFNANAVLFSFNRQFKKDHPAYATGAPYKYWENMGMNDIVQEIKKVDDLSVEFILKAPNSPFLADMAMQFMSIVSPTALMKTKDAFDQNPVGTGPYILKSWKKDDQMELEAFPKYWGDAPKIKRVIVRVIPDAQVRLLELKRGNVHIVVYPNPSEIADLESNPQTKNQIKVLKAEGLNVGYLAFNMKKKPLDKWEVREAISMAIDRKRILSEVFQNLATLAKNPMPSVILGYAKAVPEIEYNPEKAIALLKKANIKDLTLDLWSMPVSRDYNPNPKKMAEFMQADLKRVGINTNIVSYDWGTYLDKLGKGEHEMALIGWTGDNGDPDNFLATLWSKDSAEKVPTNNYSFYMNDDVTNWLKQGARENDRAKRASLYEKVQIQMAKDRPFLPIAHGLNIAPVRSEIEGYVLQPTGDRRFASVSFKDANKAP